MKSSPGGFAFKLFIFVQYVYIYIYIYIYIYMLPKPYCIVRKETLQAFADISMHTKRNTCALIKQATFPH